MDRQQYARDARVIGDDGARIGTLARVDDASQPPSLVVTLDSDGRSIRVPSEQIDQERSSGQLIVVMVSGDELLRSSAPTYEEHVREEEPTADAPPEAELEERDDSDHLTVPLAEEELIARTRDVEKGRVVLRKRVETMPHQQSIDVEHEEVDVERVSVNQDIAEAPSVRYEGDTMIVPVVEEVLVVEKRLRLVEEVRVTKRRVREESTIREDLRREVLEVDATGEGESDDAR